MSIDLNALFTKAIAELDGIPPECVTAAYIHEQREKRIYPTSRFNNYSSYPGIIFFTRQEYDKLTEIADEFWESV